MSIQPRSELPLKRLLVGVVLVALSAACVVLSHRVDVDKLDLAHVTTVKNPVKAHLKDGSTVVFRDGLTVSGGEVIGDGRLDDLTLKTSTRVGGSHSIRWSEWRASGRA